MALYKYDYYYYYYYYLQNWRVLLQVEQNRQLLRPQIETLKLCAVQNISLRGHRDDGDLGSDVVQAVNDGNYRHLLRFRIASGDEALKNSLTNASANAKHTSKTIQNELKTSEQQPGMSTYLFFCKKIAPKFLEKCVLHCVKIWWLSDKYNR